MNEILLDVQPNEVEKLWQESGLGLAKVPPPPVSAELTTYSMARVEKDPLDEARKAKHRIADRKYRQKLYRKPKPNNQEVNPRPGETKMHSFVAEVASRTGCGLTQAWKIVKRQAQDGAITLRTVHARLVYVTVSDKENNPASTNLL